MSRCFSTWCEAADGYLQVNIAPAEAMMETREARAIMIEVFFIIRYSLLKVLCPSLIDRLYPLRSNRDPIFSKFIRQALSR